MTKPVAGFIYTLKKPQPFINRTTKSTGRSTKKPNKKNFIDFDNLDHSKEQPVFVFSLKNEIRPKKSLKQAIKQIYKNEETKKEKIQASKLQKTPNLSDVPKELSPKNILLNKLSSKHILPPIPLEQLESIRQEDIDSHIFHDTLIKDFSIFKESRINQQVPLSDAPQIKRTKFTKNINQVTARISREFTGKTDKHQTILQNVSEKHAYLNSQNISEQKILIHEASNQQELFLPQEKNQQFISQPNPSKENQMNKSISIEKSERFEQQDNHNILPIESEKILVKHKEQNISQLVPDKDTIQLKTEYGSNKQNNKTKSLVPDRALNVKTNECRISPLKYYMLVDKSLSLNDQLNILLDMSMSFLVDTQSVSKMEIKIEINQKTDDKIIEMDENITRIRGEIEKWENLGKEFVNENIQQNKIQNALELLENCLWHNLSDRKVIEQRGENIHRNKHIIKNTESQIDLTAQNIELKNELTVEKMEPQEKHISEMVYFETSRDEILADHNKDPKQRDLCAEKGILELIPIIERNGSKELIKTGPFYSTSPPIHDCNTTGDLIVHKNIHNIQSLEDYYISHTISQQRRLSTLISKLSRYILFISVESSEIFKKLYVLLKKRRVNPVLVLRTMSQLKEIDLDL